MDAAAQGEDGVKAASHEEMDALNPASGIREVNLVTLVLPPQSPSPPPVNDESFLHSEHTGYHDVNPHGRGDIV